MELTVREGRHRQIFSSVSDMLDFVTNDKYIQKDSLTSSGARPATDGSYARKGFLNCIEMMQYGWPEGRDEIEKFVIDIEKRVMGYLPVIEAQYDVQGQWFDAGRYIAGEPEIFGSFVDTDQWEPTKKGGKIIHVVINIDVSWEPFKRGAAGVAIIDALERTGHRVIADGIANSTNSSGKLLETRVRVKNSDEPVQLDKLAFIFAHSDILRHILFACWERLPMPIKQMYYMHKSYGWIGDVPREDRGDIYIERSAGYMGGDLGQVAEYVLSTLKEQGVNISEQQH